MDYSTTTIICPSCESELPATADRCARCGASTRADVGPASHRPLLERPWMMTIVLLHLGVFGIPVYWRTSYSKSTRVWIVLISIVYTIFVAAVVIWGVSVIVQLMQAMP